MTKTSRQRRRERQRSGAPAGSSTRLGHGGDRRQPSDDRDLRRLVRDLWTMVEPASGSERRTALAALDAAEPDDVTAAGEIVLTATLHLAWGSGWQPAELARHARRQHATVGRVVTAAIAADLGTWEQPRLHPDWLAQAEVVATGIDPGAGWLGRAIGDEAQPRGGLMRCLVRSLVMMRTLRRLPVLLPPPGSDPATWPTFSAGVGGASRARAGADDDSAVLVKVRALLAQAESTTFEAEAEVFFAKAQELMARHSIDAARLWHSTGGADRPACVRLAVDDPYADEKTRLLSIVAGASRCRAVTMGDTGLVSIFGFRSDLATVELLYTSLLIQSQRAMMAESANAPPGSHLRSASFRRSFLFGYGGRIGARLDEITASVVADAGAADDPVGSLGQLPPLGATAGRVVGGDLLPVLAARADAVDEAIAELLGRTTTTRSGRSRYDAFGWKRGTEAADRAEINDALS